MGKRPIEIGRIAKVVDRDYEELMKVAQQNVNKAGKPILKNTTTPVTKSGDNSKILSKPTAAPVTPKQSTIIPEKKYGDKWDDLNKRVAAFKLKQELMQQKRQERQPNAIIPKVTEKKDIEKEKLQKSKKQETDFDELMRLAKQNNNEIRKPDPPPKAPILTKPKVKASAPNTKQPIVPIAAKQTTLLSNKPRQLSKHDSKRLDLDRRIANMKERHEGMMNTAHSSQRELPIPYARRQSPPRGYPPNMAYRNRRPAPYYDEDAYDDYEDYYEDDGFVVNEHDDEAQAELSRTLKSVFRYDKRRCDLREEELDRQYRAIGRVSTFEDLEREERRASRLAAAEDAKAQREEEERKRLKKIRLNKTK